MKLNINRRVLLGFLLGLLIGSPTHSFAQNVKGEQGIVGILLLAHGGKKKWNRDVKALAAQVNRTIPTEVALGMADRDSVQGAVDRLLKRRVGRIVAIPLFVSSHSSVIIGTEYLLGLRADPPSELASLSRMDHGRNDHMDMRCTSSGAAAAAMAEPSLPVPIKSPVPIRMASALDHDPVVADILMSRARSISKDPAHETVALVAHGPVSDQENAQWLGDMGAVARRMKNSSSFKSIEYLTVRDDAPEPIRSQATSELRAVVQRASQRGDRVLLVPLLISYGGIEKGIRKS